MTTHSGEVELIRQVIHADPQCTITVFFFPKLILKVTYAIVPITTFIVYQHTFLLS